MEVSSSDNEDGSSSEDKKPVKKKEIVPQKKGGKVRATCIIPDPAGEIVNSTLGPIEPWLPCIENLPNHPTMAFFGKRRTGKSTSITNILYHCCQDYPFGIVMSDTAYAGTYYY